MLICFMEGLLVGDAQIMQLYRVLSGLLAFVTQP